MSSQQQKYVVEKLTDGLIFGEGTRWRDGKLYVSDMLGKKVYTVDADGTKTVIAEMPHKPNGMGFLSDGTLILSSMHETRLYRYLPGKPLGENLELYADLSSVFTGYIGDMVIDKNDRIYVDDVGARVFEGEGLKPGRIVIVEPGGKDVYVGLEDCHFPNGIVITPDQKHLIFSETFVEHLSIVDIVDGKLVNRRVFLDMKKAFPTDEDRAGQLGCVDGIAIDAEGGIWLAVLRSHQFARIDAQGNITDRVHIPGHEVVSVALGGEDGKTLYMTGTRLKGDHPNIFLAMVALDVETSIFTTRVAVGRGDGRP
ncbi:SMP-30/gluconolactonase/LRE family protein [Pseudomonas sp. SLFW]|uniref:SMP-30/gluconolactonase/LRE family protein n=1 Tax=Pseudomonas TaxID=286 RepID=UPI0014135C11|nr:SMP-30/gluconolactonase/LRE family protein [Pseudomonas sp. SLFW]NBB09402.1 SMP-30/gluconolactonase/LRE family protein [Pseudomonas sp. SLFW]